MGQSDALATAPLVMALTAAIFGWPLPDLSTIAAHLTGLDLSRGAPKVWSIVEAVPLGLPLTGLAWVAAFGGSAAFVAHFGTRAFTDRTLVAAAVLAPLLVAGLLPGMHERCFYAAGVLVFIWAAATGRRGDRITFSLVQLGSLLGVLASATGIGQLASAGAVATIVATWRLAKPLLASPANDDRPALRPI